MGVTSGIAAGGAVMSSIDLIVEEMKFSGKIDELSTAYKNWNQAYGVYFVVDGLGGVTNSAASAIRAMSTLKAIKNLSKLREIRDLGYAAKVKELTLTSADLSPVSSFIISASSVGEKFKSFLKKSLFSGYLLIAISSNNIDYLKYIGRFENNLHKIELVIDNSNLTKKRINHNQMQKSDKFSRKSNND
ncbi:MAG: hypothetical protein IPL23_08060 [Saprospiraceae bacterium]|nr:hypothetical protein [Saprospiraceae bacterium]